MDQEICFHPMVNMRLIKRILTECNKLEQYNDMINSSKNEKFCFKCWINEHKSTLLGWCHQKPSVSQHGFTVHGSWCML